MFSLDIVLSNIASLLYPNYPINDVFYPSFLGYLDMLYCLCDNYLDDIFSPIDEIWTIGEEIPTFPFL